MSRRGWLIAASLSALVTGACSSTSKVRLPPAEAVPCTVSPVLVPSCGAWLGSSTPSEDGNFDSAAGLREYEQVAQNTPDILHYYKRDDDPFPTADEIAMSQRAGKQRSLLFFNWKPSTTLTWRQVADGAVDDRIDAVAASLVAYGRPLFLTLHHEPENDVGPDGSGMTTVDYVDMFRHVVTRLRAGGADQAVIAMTYIGAAQWADIVDDLYPGDDVVDWIAYDPYARADQSTFARLLDRPNQQGWPGFYTWATRKAPGKPIMLAEWGIDLATQAKAPQILDQAADTLAEDFPEVKALVYWNGHRDDLQVRLDQGTELGARYAEAYARMASSAYFNQTSVP